MEGKRSAGATIRVERRKSSRERCREKGEGFCLVRTTRFGIRLIRDFFRDSDASRVRRRAFVLCRRARRWTQNCAAIPRGSVHAAFKNTLYKKDRWLSDSRLSAASRWVKVDQNHPAGMIFYPKTEKLKKTANR